VRTTVSAAVLRKVGDPLRFEQLTLEEPRADEILVRMVASGICQTDAHVRRGHIPASVPIVLGHEGAGIVEQVGAAVRSVTRGDHVVLSYQSCGHCPSCWSGHPSYCDDAFAANFSGVRADGSAGLRTVEGKPVLGRFFGQSSFATHALATERNVVKVPSDLPLDLLAPLGCGIQTGAGAILRALSMQSGAAALVFGVGAVGMAAVMAARLAGAATVIAADVHPERLALALDLGATHCIDVGRVDVTAEIKRICRRGVDVILDTSGHKDSLAAGLASLAPGGRFGFVAFHEGSDATLHAAALFVGKRLQGIIQGDVVPQLFIPELIALHRAGRFPFNRLIRTYEFAAIEDAFADAAAGRVIKPVLRFPPSPEQAHTAA
jgi:aryl-alcohol dehydrogenase